MDWATILGFTFIATLLVVSPGPNGVLLVKTLTVSGKTGAFANIVGFFTAFYVHGAFAIFGISLILVQSAYAFFIVKILGAIYLCWIGCKALYDAWKGISTQKVEISAGVKKRTLIKAYLEGFLTNALNPKVSMFYMAAFPQFIPTTETAIQSAFMLVTIHSMLNVLWFSSMVIVLAYMTKAVRSDSFQRWVKALTGVVFIGFGIKLVTLRAS